MLAKDDWIYITEDIDAHCWDLKPQLFKTKKEAENAAKIWNKRATKIVRYKENTV